MRFAPGKKAAQIVCEKRRKKQNWKLPAGIRMKDLKCLSDSSHMLSTDSKVLKTIRWCRWNNLEERRRKRIGRWIGWKRKSIFIQLWHEETLLKIVIEAITLCRYQRVGGGKLSCRWPSPLCGCVLCLWKWKKFLPLGPRKEFSLFILILFLFFCGLHRLLLSS